MDGSLVSKNISSRSSEKFPGYITSKKKLRPYEVFLTLSLVTKVRSTPLSLSAVNPKNLPNYRSIISSGLFSVAAGLLWFTLVIIIKYFSI